MSASDRVALALILVLAGLIAWAGLLIAAADAWVAHDARPYLRGDARDTAQWRARPLKEGRRR